jgi:predicted AAA+ superfamily ATPase
MGKKTTRYFSTGAALANVIQTQTAPNDAKFERRAFVSSVIKYCLDGNYTAKVGLVFGLRSTGKTVGMLQAAEELMEKGHEVAYARFTYDNADIQSVNDEIERLAKQGVTHFFLNEAPYVIGCLNGCAAWADTLVPDNRIKIVISGTDNFELWLTMDRALYHRYVRFPTNRNSFAEFNRVLGQSYDEYKTSGGVFSSNDEAGVAESVISTETNAASAMERFVQSAVVNNLVRALKHCDENPGAKGDYYKRLFGVDETVIFKAIISILEATVAGPIRKNFILDFDGRNMPGLGEASSRRTKQDKRDVKERIAESLSVYEEFQKIQEPGGTIDALTEFLIRIGCLVESSTGASDLTRGRRALYFAHNALMNFAVQETKAAILTLTNIKQRRFVDALEQAAEGSLNANIVYCHLLLSLKGKDKLFRYHDPLGREIDAALVNRETKKVILVEVKSKSKIDKAHFHANEAKHLLNREILETIGIDGSFAVRRVVVYKGEEDYAYKYGNIVLFSNIENFLRRYFDIGAYIDEQVIEIEDRLKSQKRAMPQ